MVASTMIRGPRERVRGVRASSESVSILESEHRGCRLSSCTSAEVYVASRLLSLFPKDESLSSQLRIHFYYNLLAPHGLVRYGVAPDHPEVKVRSAHDPPFVSFL